MYVANVAEDGFENNPYIERLQEFAAQENSPVVAVCAAIEAETVTPSSSSLDRFSIVSIFFFGCVLVKINSLMFIVIFFFVYLLLIYITTKKKSGY